MNGAAGAARAVMRSLLLLPLSAACISDFLLSSASRSIRDRVRWLSRSSVRHAKWMGVRINVHGEIPTGGLIVSNHVSYVDIVALSAVAACAFVSKKEVARWPLFGLYARCGATIFVDRERRSAVADVAGEMRERLDAGVPLTLFPEGTSTDGKDVLPFRSSLFEPVVELGCPVTACALRYSLNGGSVADEVAYWGDMRLAPHLLNFLGKTGVTLDIRFGPSSHRTGDRKTLARDLHTEVCALLHGSAA
ncbi:MAG: lysophospholipid acyltransferase family protein [Chthoniobacteraceae bacterium]